MASISEDMREAMKKDLVNFMQYILYHGGEVTLTVNGVPGISKEQAEILVENYIALTER